MSFEHLERFALPTHKETVVISRHWDSPNITVTVNKDRITVECSLDDLIDGMLQELKSPEIMWKDTGEKGKSAWLWIRSLYPLSVAISHEQLQRNIKLAVSSALEKIKEATCQVM
jgi:hypothetical protein